MTTATKTTIVMGLAVMLIGASLAIGESDRPSGDRDGHRQGKGMRGYRKASAGRGPYAMLRVPKIGEMLRRLDLTDDQKKQVREIRRETRKGFKDLKDVEDKTERREAHQTAMKAADQKIYNEVLTAEQKAKVDAIRAKKKDIALTDAQEKQIKEIMKAAHDKINKEVLTDKQRAAIKELKAKHQERRKGRKGGEHPSSKGEHPSSKSEHPSSKSEHPG